MNIFELAPMQFPERQERLLCSNFLIIQRTPQYLEWPGYEMLNVYNKYNRENNRLPLDDDYRLTPIYDIPLLRTLTDMQAELVRRKLLGLAPRIVTKWGKRERVDDLIYYPLLLQFVDRVLDSEYDGISFYSMLEPPTQIVKSLSDAHRADAILLYKRIGSRAPATISAWCYAGSSGFVYESHNERGDIVVKFGDHLVDSTALRLGQLTRAIIGEAGWTS